MNAYVCSCLGGMLYVCMCVHVCLGDSVCEGEACECCMCAGIIGCGGMCFGSVNVTAMISLWRY